MCNFKPQVILNIDEVWETKYKAFQVLAAQKHLWAYYERVALNRGVQGGRNTGKPMTYGEAYQRLFPHGAGGTGMKPVVVRNIERADANAVGILAGLGVSTVHEAHGPFRADENLHAAGLAGRARRRVPPSPCWRSRATTG